ncbi:hypothetical protein ABEV74_08335 [Paenibacillus cisolokensis]|uniref:hypothetical protein n=1 Tax=Paenibacillus cisolokensis TaxID=1658519 RepID=UPI003D29EAA5
MWTQIWFWTNCVFVAFLIVFLFSHRAVTEARHAGEGESCLHKLKVRRRIFGTVAAVAFVAMTASFLINMRLNG